MAGSFPTLKSGNTVFYPLVEGHSFNTGIHKFVDDSEQRWRNRLSLRKYVIACNDISAYDVSLLRSFHRTQFGKFDSSWDLTVSGATHSNLAFDNDEFQIVESKPNRMTVTFQVVQVKSANPTIPTAYKYFPQILSQGVVTSLPYETRLGFKTSVQEMESGKRYAYKWRSASLGQFTINLPAMRVAEAETLRDFIYACEGRLRQFAFMDPGGNLVNYSDDFSHASWVKTSVTVGSAVTDPFRGSLAIACTASSSDSSMYSLVIPGGNASGFVVCASAWVRAISAGQSLSIGLTDNTGANLGRTSWNLPQNSWIRIFHSMTLATNLPVRMIIGGNSTWDSTSIQLFSAQCVPMPGPGPRLLTPGADSLRPKCRLGTDEVQITHTSLNKLSATILVEEYT